MASALLNPAGTLVWSYVLPPQAVTTPLLRETSEWTWPPANDVTLRRFKGTLHWPSSFLPHATTIQSCGLVEFVPPLYSCKLVNQSPSGSSLASFTRGF